MLKYSKIGNICIFTNTVYIDFSKLNDRNNICISGGIETDNSAIIQAIFWCLGYKSNMSYIECININNIGNNTLISSVELLLERSGEKCKFKRTLKSKVCNSKKINYEEYYINDKKFDYETYLEKRNECISDEIIFFSFLSGENISEIFLNINSYYKENILSKEKENEVLCEINKIFNKLYFRNGKYNIIYDKENFLCLLNNNSIILSKNDLSEADQMIFIISIFLGIRKYVINKNKCEFPLFIDNVFDRISMSQLSIKEFIKVMQENKILEEK